MSVPFSPEQFGPSLQKAKVPLDEVEPSQVYMDGAKIDRMRRSWSRDMAEPIVTERNGRYIVLDGHHRVEAAKERGHKWLRARQAP